MPPTPATISAAPRIVVFAGPNGAGKSTHADAILAGLGIEVFVNADFIARGLSGRSSDAVAFEAGRIMLRRLRQLAQDRQEFAFESTLSSRSFAPFLQRQIDAGYRVSVYYFSLASAALALQRVRLRVQQGGHDVAADVVRRRFGRSLGNFMTLYAPMATQWAIFDNSSLPRARLVALQQGNGPEIKDPVTWRKLQKLALKSR